MHKGFADAHVEVGVFRVSFLVSAHARITIQFHHQGGEDVDSDRPRFRCGSRVDVVHQVEVEGAADGQALRINRGAGEHAPVRAFFIFHYRNLQARLGERDLLQLVEVFRLLACAFLQNLIGEREETAGGPDLIDVSSGGEFPARLLLSGNGSAQLTHINTR